MPLLMFAGLFAYQAKIIDDTSRAAISGSIYRRQMLARSRGGHAGIIALSVGDEINHLVI